ncbi:hypothetical protein NC651_003052 [Populus alba x Populus x berolinensis]|nr:hypothetical protein NC651_003052 [Populus alba x Populus x berolinensis]
MAQATKQIFILGRQSNMSCRGGAGGVKDSHHNHKIWDGVVPLECQPHPNSSIILINIDADAYQESMEELIESDSTKLPQSKYEIYRSLKGEYQKSVQKRPSNFPT